MDNSSATHVVEIDRINKLIIYTETDGNGMKRNYIACEGLFIARDGKPETQFGNKVVVLMRNASYNG